jgi:hypothetical protein
MARNIIPEQVLRLFRQWGREGGDKAAAIQTPEEIQARNRKAGKASGVARRKKARARKAAQRAEKRKAR